MPKPSISTSIWFNVCSRSSCPPPSPEPRLRATASISSINTIHGELLFASANRSLTREAPTPTNISTKSEPERLKNGTPASPATALARRVLPVPGGPTSIMPLGIRAPTPVYFPGLARKSTISSNSSFSSLSPATSWNVLACWSLGSIRCARLLPKFIILALLPLVPADCADRKENRKNIAIIPRPYGSRVVIIHEVFCISWTLYLLANSLLSLSISSISFTSDT